MSRRDIDGGKAGGCVVGEGLFEDRVGWDEVFGDVVIDGGPKLLVLAFVSCGLRAHVGRIAFL